MNDNHSIFSANMAFVSTFTQSVNLTSASKRAGYASSLTVSRRARRTQVAAKPRRAVVAMAEGLDSSPPAVKSETDLSGSNGSPEPGPTTPDQISISYDDSEVREVIVDENLAGFCSVDPNTGKRLELSLREKEALFLDAVQSFFRGESLLSDEEFDSLKEELTWQGSEVVTLDRDEFQFLNAARAYEQGKSIMDDGEFDDLKKKLFEKGSVVAIQRGPRCSIQRRVTFSDIIPDKKRTFVLYVPAGLIFALSWLSFAFEFTPLHQIDPVLSLLIGSPIIFLGARLLTGLVVPKGVIMVGDCPSCGRRTHVLFGNVLNQKGFADEALVKCPKCKAELKIELESSRMILIKEGSAA